MNEDLKCEPTEAEIQAAMRMAIAKSRMPVIVKPKVLKVAKQSAQQLDVKRIKKRKGARAQVARSKWNSR